MNNKSAFTGLIKLEKRSAGEVVRLGKVKFPFRPQTKNDDPVVKLIEELVAQNLLMDALKILALALPPREGIWWGCLAARDTTMKDGKKTKALEAAEAWVFKPSQETKKAAEKLAQEPGDSDVEMAEAAFNVPLPDDEEPPMAPPQLVGLLIFSVQLESFFSHKLPEDINRQGQLLLARGLDVAKGGNGQIGEEAENNAEAPIG
ncbi:MAG: hypothetical protein L3J33_10770 [Rhodobacteraceae bacterium]|nr:hypothetical protein [Paracoccaceae bacterium]